VVEVSVTAEVSEKLRALPDSSAIAMRLKSEQYFDAIQGMIDRFAMKKDLEVVYVTSTIPSQSIINALEVLEIPMDHIWFVDCISQIMMSQEKRHPHAIIVESPTMLENIMLKVEFLLRRVPERNALVVLDSINSLAIHNNTKILSEFLHILVNNLRSRGAYTVIFSMQEYETEEIRNMLVLVSDETIELGALPGREPH
jgi:KaiC/GvpD/RAD55 family RecA-like ATPase